MLTEYRKHGTRELADSAWSSEQLTTHPTRFRWRGVHPSYHRKIRKATRARIAMGKSTGSEAGGGCSKQKRPPRRGGRHAVKSCAGRNRTTYLQVMSLASYRCSTAHDYSNASSQDVNPSSLNCRNWLGLNRDSGGATGKLGHTHGRVLVDRSLRTTYFPARLSQVITTSFFCLGPGVLRPSTT